MLETLEHTIDIKQKVLHYTPVEKLYTAWIALLAGARALVEINKRLRADRALMRAFGLTQVPDQSTVQATLNACTDTNVAESHAAFLALFRRKSRAYRHRYGDSVLVLDIDLSGLPCGKKAALASKSFFAKAGTRRARHLCRVLATDYREIVADRLFSGKTQLTSCLGQAPEAETPAPTAFSTMVEAAETALALDRAKRSRTVLRVDAAAGSVDQINWVLERGYHYHGKDFSGKRAARLAESVTHWIDDPKIARRQMGYVEEPAVAYRRAVRRIAVRCRKRNGQWGHAVIISTLSSQEVIALTKQPVDQVADPVAVLRAYVYFYDGRGGGVETSFKEDKQGLGLTKRTKKRFAAQQVLIQLNALAHNVIVWMQAALQGQTKTVAGYGVLRMVRDVFGVSGLVVFDDQGDLRQLVLNEDDPLTPGLVKALSILLAHDQVVVNWGQT